MSACLRACLPACMHAHCLPRSSVQSRCYCFCVVLAYQLWAKLVGAQLLALWHTSCNYTSCYTCAASSYGAGKPLPGRSAGLLTGSVCACAAAVVLLLASSLPQVRAWYQNKQYFVGSYESEEAAARAYDRHILKLAGPTARMQNARWGRWSGGAAEAGRDWRFFLLGAHCSV